MKAVFFGASRFVIPIIETLNANFELSLIVTTEKNSTDAVSSYCIEHKITYLSISTSHDLLNLSRGPLVNVDLAVLAYFGLILPKKVLDLFPKGILNIHPSLLPKYRGPTPVQTSLLNADSKTGVTLMKLDEELDHGPIVDQIEESLLPADTAETLYERLFKIGAKLLDKNIDQYMKGNLNLIEQKHTHATYTKPLDRKNGYVDISNLPSPEKLDRMIRAYFPWPGVWGKWKMKNGQWKIIKFLPDKRIQVEGKKPITIKDFLNGYPESKVWIEKIFKQ